MKKVRKQGWSLTPADILVGYVQAVAQIQVTALFQRPEEWQIAIGDYCTIPKVSKERRYPYACNN